MTKAHDPNQTTGAMIQGMCAAGIPQAQKAIAVILDRGYGKPMQGVELMGKDGKNLSPTVIILPSNGRETS